MSDLQLVRASFARTSTPLISVDDSLENLSPALACRVGKHISECLQGWDGPLPERHFMCSTIMDLAFANRLIDWDCLQQQMEQYTQAVPDVLVNAYECASWGYCLRQALTHPSSSPYVMITIVDLNLLNLSFWEANPDWGKSGFGIATLLFRVGADAINCLQVGVAKTSNFIAEFSIAVRQYLEVKHPHKLALPFFPKQVTQLFQRLLPQADSLPDLHPLLGHCFGADPWISLIEYASQAVPDERLLATSVALNGYWAMADVSLAHDGKFTFREEE
ncbi:hypothetical protein [Xenorhabdus kozodoii]|uniref:Uncharacterized protein n=1 Tax=Xenorhabdus kozodoii TaxID=351676 RepID=A0A2D0L4K0_9GAMM|nr:hypothetical protein [Xenorhabdus kozodoii]PHM70604.1 hypothetical protein Xkoz_03044 [Xenorhabdus kozodoii]